MIKAIILSLIVAIILLVIDYFIGDNCQCYYDKDGKRVWNGYKCKKHGKR
jgi:hypothetical protein